jgi:hypothetical protein
MLVCDVKPVEAIQIRIAIAIRSRALNRFSHCRADALCDLSHSALKILGGVRNREARLR